MPARMPQKPKVRPVFPNLKTDYNQNIINFNECICGIPIGGEMIGCDGPNCPKEWYHVACVGLTQAPAGPWLCPSCRPIPVPQPGLIRGDNTFRAPPIFTSGVPHGIAPSTQQPQQTIFTPVGSKVWAAVRPADQQQRPPGNTRRVHIRSSSGVVHRAPIATNRAPRGHMPNIANTSAPLAGNNLPSPPAATPAAKTLKIPVTPTLEARENVSSWLEKTTSDGDGGEESPPQVADPSTSVANEEPISASPLKIQNLLNPSSPPKPAPPESARLTKSGKSPTHRTPKKGTAVKKPLPTKRPRYSYVAPPSHKLGKLGLDACSRAEMVAQMNNVHAQASYYYPESNVRSEPLLTGNKKEGEGEEGEEKKVKAPRGKYVWFSSSEDEDGNGED